MKIIKKRMISNFAIVLVAIVLPTIAILGWIGGARYFPARVLLEEEVFEILRERYENPLLLCNYACVVVAVALGVIWYLGLEAFISFRLERLGESVFELRPGSDMLILASLLSAIAVAAFLVDDGFSLWAGNARREFQMYASERFEREWGVDARFALPCMLIFFILYGFVNGDRKTWRGAAEKRGARSVQATSLPRRRRPLHRCDGDGRHVAGSSPRPSPGSCTGASAGPASPPSAARS
ncbi:hypothetical protein ElP_41170 [Tautonia plasticadhaerens]|uniref:Uncharacterized protein n=1 Tax=Tautonia plasticadhaerens TaxID=2527974 RepID=A0A518H5T1_9BACT|nr:hypothetical protein ElP_41170 [Tautonia plasticadhaerens]